MKVTVRNLGVIKDEATFDLKPLTIFIGPNNAGKTWLAYAIAAVLGDYGSRRYLDAYVKNKTPERYQKLDSLAKQIAENGDGVLEIVQFVDECGEQCINAILSFAKTWIQKFLGTDRVKFETLHIGVDFAEIKPQLLQYLQNISVEHRIGQDKDSVLLRALKEPGENRLFFYPGQDIKERLPARAVREFVVDVVSQMILQFFYPDIYIFPTERTYIIADQFMAIPAGEAWERLKKSTRSIERILPELRPQPEYMNKFVEMIARLHASASLTERKARATEENSIQRYMQLADILQEDILEGCLDFSTPDPDLRRELLFKPARCLSDGPIEMELSVASSMVKELSALVLYLRYLAQPGELLVIDEPEMNLHPVAQVKMLELLAMLVNAGLRVLFTTHSPYITGHLTNLIKGSECEDKEQASGKFFLKRPEAFIKRDRVAVYGMNDGKVIDVLDEEGFINEEGLTSGNTFGGVSERIANIFLNL